MENIENIYDDTRQGNTTQTYATSDSQTENTQTKVSGSRKWANRIFTTFAIIGWTIGVTLLADATFNQSKLIIRIMAGQ